MKKLLFPLLFLLSYSPSHATWFFGTKEPPKQIPKKTSKLQKCIGTTALLLSTLSGLGDIKNKESVKLGLQVLGEMKKDLENHQAAKDLCDAIDNENYNLAIQLLQKKPHLDINARFYDITALMKCCCNGDESINVVQNILKHPKFDITIKNRSGLNCLHYACSWGRAKITKLLLEKEDIAKVLNAKDKTNNGETPLDRVVLKARKSWARIEHVTVWNMMVAKGAQLHYYKQEYKKLNSNDFKPPHSHYIKFIKSNPPREVKLQKHSLVRQPINNNQEGMIQGTSGYQGEGGMKEEE